MSSFIGNYVKRSGDSMTGDLNLGLNRLILNDGVNGAAIKGMTSPNTLAIMNIADSNRAHVYAYNADFLGNVDMAATKTVDGRDISALVRAKIKVGTYTGDATDDRTINIGIDLTAKSNVYIVIKSTGLDQAVHRAEYGQGDGTFRYDAIADQSNNIQSLNAMGFVIGSDSNVNTNGRLFRYMVFYEEP